MFKVGDTVRGYSGNGYMRTTSPYMCRVTEIFDDTMEVQLIDGPFCGEKYIVKNSGARFGLVTAAKNNISLFN